jgi:5'(3')-deoxyribonucleotidase
MAEHFVLGVDLDGVVGDFYAYMRVVAAEWLGKPLDDLPTEVQYSLPEWGLTGETYIAMHRFAVTQRGLFREMEPIEGAPPTLRRLSDHGVHIRIVTHRLFIAHFHREAVQQTIDWLDHYGIPYSDLCFTGEKVAVGADLYIEDAPHNVEALRTVAPTIVFTNSTNRSIDGLRADDWSQAEELVLQQKAEWERDAAGMRKAVSGN